MDRQAAPRPGDDPLMARLRPMLAGTQLEEEELRVAYSAAGGAAGVPWVTGVGRPKCVALFRACRGRRMIGRSERSARRCGGCCKLLSPPTHPRPPTTGTS